MATVRFGNSDALETGQSVFAIGDALGKYQHTVTRGVVSGLERDVSVDSSRPRYKNLIETDATINQGNSGGPLINMSGEVIGMTTLLEQGSGLGFAIPSNYIQSTLEQLKSLGKATRPYLGVSYTRVDQAVKAVAGLSASAGAYVQSVTGGSPAANAGVRPGDVITHINGEALAPVQELDKLLIRFASGTQILLHINRAGQELDLPVILGEYK
jgi:S1-C subfamily serine protease